MVSFSITIYRLMISQSNHFPRSKWIKSNGIRILGSWGLRLFDALGGRKEKVDEHFRNGVSPWLEESRLQSAAHWTWVPSVSLGQWRVRQTMCCIRIVDFRFVRQQDDQDPDMEENLLDNKTRIVQRGKEKWRLPWPKTRPSRDIH